MSSRNPTYSEGFELTGQKLKSVYDYAIDRMGIANLTVTYKLRYKNHYVKDDFVSLDKVTSEYHGGKRIIESLAIDIKKDASPSPQITLEFLWPSSLGQVSMKYSIKGDNNDWVVTTDSTLEDMMLDIKKFSLPLFLSRPFIALIASLIEMLLVLYFITSLIIFYFFSSTISKSGSILNIFLFGSPSNLIISCILLVATLITALVGYICFPPYNFFWGAYASKIETKRRWGKGILTLIWIAFVVGVIASFVGAHI